MITMKKLKVTEVKDEFYIPYEKGRDNLYKGDILIYKIKRKRKRI